MGAALISNLNNALTILFKWHPCMCTEGVFIFCNILTSYSGCICMIYRPKNSYSFERLELNITCFLSTFYSLMSRLLTDFQHTSGLRQRLDPQTAAITRESKGVRSRSSREAGLGPGQLVKQSNWSMRNQDMFQELEKCLDSFLMQGEGLQDHDSLYFDLQYLTGDLLSCLQSALN